MVAAAIHDKIQKKKGSISFCLLWLFPRSKDFFLQKPPSRHSPQKTSHVFHGENWGMTIPKPGRENRITLRSVKPIPGAGTEVNFHLV